MSKENGKEKKRDRKRDWAGACVGKTGDGAAIYYSDTCAHVVFTIHHISCREDYRSVGFERLIVLSVV